MLVSPPNLQCIYVDCVRKRHLSDFCRIHWLETPEGKEAQKKYQALRYQRNKEWIKNHEKRKYNSLTPLLRKDRNLRDTYNIILEQFNDLLAAQGTKCPICQSLEPGAKGWTVDHDHGCCPGKRSCGKCVRGVLCGPCNLGIGSLKDNPIFLQNAVNYLIKVDV